MVFVGLELMSAAMADFAKMDGLTSFFASIKNTWLLIVAGALLSVFGIPFGLGIIYATLTHETTVIAQALCGLASYIHESFIRRK